MGLSDFCSYYQPNGGDWRLLPRQRTRFFLSYNILAVYFCLSRLPSASPFNPLFPSSLISLACALLFTCGGAAACSLRCPEVKTTSITRRRVSHTSCASLSSSGHGAPWASGARLLRWHSLSQFPAGSPRASRPYPSSTAT